MLAALTGAALALSAATTNDVIVPAAARASVTTSAVTHALTQDGPITAVWANTGEDKVTREELRASRGRRSVINSAWAGSKVTLFGAKNEVVAFNMVLEAANTAARDVTVTFDTLNGPDGAQIHSTPARNAAGMFNWVNRDIELFYVRYLTIRGLSVLSYGNYDERHIPTKLRRPKAADGSYRGDWTDRPNHDKAYPDIAVPMEAVKEFAIPARHNQSIWVDIYIPKTVPAGTYVGKVLIRVNGRVQYSVPVRLTVRDFELPDAPSSKTMIATNYSDVAKRYTGVEYPNPGTPQDALTKRVMDRQMMLAHRHKLSMIDDNGGASAWTQDAPRPEWVPRLTGALFTNANGYRGPGEGVGNNVFSIGTFGAWQDWWGTPTAANMATHTNGWETWFRQHSPSTERFLYLIDESDNYAQTQKWANWVQSNSGPGGTLPTFATADLLESASLMPSLDITASWIAVADPKTWNPAVAEEKAVGHSVFSYNGMRPASGSFATEDEGVALRELAWGQYKKGINRWFFWNATYYNDYQGGRGDTNVFDTAQTFGGAPSRDPVLGMTGWNSSNGDGVLFYPGTDKIFKGESYGIDGPIASLRMKFWRRGVQDVDYLAMAAKIDPAAVQAIVKQMVPKVMWEVGVGDPSDPSWVMGPVYWSTDPDVWEQARDQLADIIERGGG
jgi:hypothetical protein